MKKLMVILAMAVALAVMAVPALAWDEGPGTDWYFINANVVDGNWYNTPPPVIEINGNPSDGQTFNVGDTINITCHVHAYAASCAGWANEAYTNAGLQVTGPSGPGSDTAEDYDYSDYCAEVDTEVTLSIASYTLTAVGTHEVYANSYAAVAQYYYDVAEESVDASLTFEVVPAVIPVNIDIKPGSWPNSINLGSKGVIPVAIFSTPDFDATQVDPDTVALAGAGVALRGKGNKSLAHEEDVNGDGLPDLVVQVETENLEPSAFQDGFATLIGQTFGGQDIQGSDEIVVVPPE